MLLYPIHHFLLGNIWTSTMFISKIAFVSPCLPAQTLVILLSPFPCVCTHHHKQHPSMDTSECQSNWLSNTFYHGLSAHTLGSLTSFCFSILSHLWLVCPYMGKTKQLPWSLREKKRSTEAFHGTLQQTDWIWSSKNETDFFKIR